MKLAVANVKDEAEGVKLFQLQHQEDGSLPSWQPGAHIDVTVLGDEERQYSLCGVPGDSTWEIAVLLDPIGRGGSRYMHEDVSIGGSLDVRGPRNHFPLISADSFLFIAGGIGITPLRSMIRQVSEQGSNWELMYGGRRRSAMAFVGELERAGDGRVTVWPEDERGILPIGDLLSHLSPECAVYCCGPEGLLRAVEQASEELNLPAPHVERFAPAKDLVEERLNEAFEVELMSTGEVLIVEGDETIMSVLEKHGYPVDYSCREGVCGTCETKVFGGQPVHYDFVLSPEEQSRGDCMMICVSRARSGVRLRLER
jgi:ferredoxin-NADP reductase